MYFWYRARLTVPHYLNAVELSEGGIGVLALEAISNKTQLGPFEAKKTMRDINRDDLFVLKVFLLPLFCSFIFFF